MYRLFIFSVLNFLAAMSPGPDFAVITRFGLTGSRRAALYATLGVGVALFVHVTYSVLGVSVILAQNPHIFQIIQLVGACYLLYIAVPMLLPEKEKQNKTEALQAKQAFMTGFWTNLLNPKASVLIFSLFVQFLEPSDSLTMKALFGLSVPLCTVAWFGTYSYLLTHPAFLPVIRKGQKPITVCMGVLLISISLFIIFKMFIDGTAINS